MGFFDFFSKPKKEDLDPGLEKTKQSFLSKISRAIVGKSKVDEEVLDELEEVLISSDVGVTTTLKIIERIEKRVAQDKVMNTDELHHILRDEIVGLLSENEASTPSNPEQIANEPYVIMVVGVNGVGKTTTIGKLAYQFKKAGYSVVLGAADTFRAAAVEQLQVWGERAGVPVLTAPEGSDPASLAFDAMNKCKNDNVDLLMIDTAGRLQNRKDLMEELDKIVRVIQKNDPSAPHNTLLVLDATTGQNAIRQVEVFQEVSKVTGLVMTKLDGTAKGGVLVALADKFGLPIHAIGVGEQIDDLQAFDPKDFAKALTGSDV